MAGGSASDESCHHAVVRFKRSLSQLPRADRSVNDLASASQRDIDWSERKSGRGQSAAFIGLYPAQARRPLPRRRLAGLCPGAGSQAFTRRGLAGLCPGAGSRYAARESEET
jgi:hypothetical protein